MGAFLSLDFVKTVVEIFIFILFISFFKGVLLPNQHGACVLLPKVIDQLQKLEHRKATDDEDFPGSELSFSLPKKCKWMKKIHDIRPIGQIIWPGTHYSATNKIGIPFITRPFGQRQTMGIYEQLLNGVRALDIRIQQDRLVCNGSMLCNSTVGDIIKDVKRFLKETYYEILILEIKTEQGFTDPNNFEDYLVEELGDLLIYQDDQVFSKSISDVLPRRIICIWKPITFARKFRQGGPIWSEKYLKCDEIDTQMPLTRFDGNINSLRKRSLALKTNNFFYKVENTLNPKTSTILESLLIWPKHANVVSKRINGFARLFFAKCHNDGILHRMQICSVDFVDDEFISACIGLNYEAIAAVKETNNTNRNDNTTLTWERDSCDKRIYPKSLKITHIEDDKCWTWNGSFAHLLRTNSLNVSGNYKVDNLPQGRYEVVFSMKVLDSAFGWESPIHLRLILPDGSIQKNRVILDMTPTRLEYIPFGNFIISEHTRGDIKFSIEQLQSTLKGGIVIRYVVIQPFYIDMVIPRNLSIKSHRDLRCWNWHTEDSRLVKGKTERPEMVGVRDFWVSGVFETGKLLFWCTYKLGFLIVLSNSSSGWESPTKLTLLLPNGSSQQRIASFNKMPKNELLKVYVGEFKMSPRLVGQLKFSMENDDSNQKSGLNIYMAFIEQQH